MLPPLARPLPAAAALLLVSRLYGMVKCAQRVWLGLLLLCFLATGAWAQEQARPAGQGFIEEVHFNPETRRLRVAGWAASELPNVFVSNIAIRLGEQEIYRGRIERFDRPGVAQHTGRDDWLWSGFTVEVPVPESVPPGPHAVSFQARLSSGGSFDLLVTDGARKPVEVPAVPAAPGLLALAAFALLLPVLVLVVAGSAGSSGWVPLQRLSRHPRRVFAATVLVAFALLVGAGLSGSSLQIALSGSGITQHDGRVLAGELRPIRSDEWEVITPMALSQRTQQPAWPVQNPAWGLDGHNMLVVGMTGVPVAHLSALAKPATWGFLAFDLRRGLAWSWWFPFFACFGALWLLLQRMFQLEWRLAAGLAAAFAVAPYSVVFSGWPAYVAFFPLMGLVLADGVLRSQRTPRALVGGAALGVCMAGFALVLYPAWQISLAYLLVPLALGWWYSRRRELHFGLAQGLALVLAVAVAAVLLGAWWVDAATAIKAIRATVYPGQRLAEVGGDIDSWFLLKGLLAPVLMYAPPALASAVDSSYFLLLLPVAAALLYAWARARQVPLVSLLPALYILVVLWFIYIGFAPWFARWSMWGSSTSQRQDVGLGLAQTLLLAWLLALAARAPAMPGASAAPRAGMPQPAAALVALLAAWLTWVSYRWLPSAADVMVPWLFRLLSVAAVALAAFWLLTGRTAAFALLYCGWMLGSALWFNPLVQAPASVALDARLQQQLVAVGPGTPGPEGPRGVAVVGPRVWAVVLPATGVPVVNSVFYVPPKAFWQRMDPQGLKTVVHNRYQRLLLELAPVVAEATHRIETPRLDEVRVTLDPARFDFRQLGAQTVLAAPKDRAALDANPSLRRLDQTEVWVLYQVQALPQ